MTLTTKLTLQVAKNQLSAEELFEVHQLTYTLENTLQKIPTEMTDIAAMLEGGHLVSDKNDGVTVKTRTQVYLEKSADLAN